MPQQIRHSLLRTSALIIAACSSETASNAVDPACVEAGPEGCDAELADAALSMSCDELAVDDVQPNAVTLEIDADEFGATIRTKVIELTDPVPGL